MRIGIIGAGPAGVFAGISAATHGRSAGIEIFEATHEPLHKVLISGGGRCNVTHNCLEPSALVENYPRGRKELLRAFTKFQPRDTIEWFENHGVRLKAEEDGRMFPVTDRSSTVAQCLLEEAERLGVGVLRGMRVKNVAVGRLPGNKRFRITFNDGSGENFDRVLVATGSGSHGYGIAERLGHSVTPCVPSLFTFKVSDRRMEGLAGISFRDVELSLMVGSDRFRQRGPMLITHWGLSGPAVLKLSAWGARELHRARYTGELSVNFVPGHSAGQVREHISNYRRKHPKRTVSSDSPIDIPRRYWERIVEVAGIDGSTTWSHVSNEQARLLVSEFAEAKYVVAGKGVFKEEFVTCGGVNLAEVDFRTMQSKLCPGLFFAGEVLDIDGVTGGFNFQSAWTTGWIAGAGMVAQA